MLFLGAFIGAFIGVLIIKGLKRMEAHGQKILDEKAAAKAAAQLEDQTDLS